MNEPVSATAAAGITLAGVSAAVTAALGVDVTTICWALAGGWFGSSFAPKVGPIATVVQFVLASLISALAATVAAEPWSLNPTQMHLLAAGLSMSFYALKKILFSRLGAIVERVIEAAFGQHQDKSRKP